MCRLEEAVKRESEEKTPAKRKCAVPNRSAAWLTEALLSGYNILIKDLSGKQGLNGEYIRLAVRRPEENERLLAAMRELLA
jgi:histidinol-phosphate/aromatic aminotransferase/cobyric acid decarboxylase-like protein